MAPKETPIETPIETTETKASVPAFDLDTFKKGLYSIGELKSFAEDKTNPIHTVLLATIASIEKRLAKAATKLSLPEAKLTNETVLINAPYVLLERMGDSKENYRQDLYLTVNGEAIHILLLGGQTCPGDGEGKYTGTIFWRESGQEFRGITTTVSQWVLGSVERSTKFPEYLKGMKPVYEEL